MRFYSAIKGQLILIRPLKPAPQPIRPIVATRPAPDPDPLWLAILLTICVWLRPLLGNATKKPGQIGVFAKRFYGKNWPKVAVLMFLAGVTTAVVLENIAAGYLDKIMLGV